MKTLARKNWLPLAAFAATTLVGAAPALAQNTAPPSSTRFTVDLKDATLRDALELVFQAAGNPSHIIDPAASQVRIGTVSFKDQEWRDIVRILASQNKFRLRRENGSWIVDPRPDVRAYLPSELGLPKRDLSVLTTSKADFSVQTLSSAQVGTTTGSTNGTLSRPTPVDSTNPWSIIEPVHTYAGAFALFFSGGTVVGTAEFIVPSSGIGLRNSNNNNNNTNNNGTNTNGTNGTGTGFGGTGTSGTGGVIISR